MRLRTRLIILIGAAAIIPLGILGFGAINVSVDRLTQKAADSQARAADQMASEIDLWLQFQLLQVAEQVDAFQLAKLNDRKLKGFQQLVFQQLTDVHIVSVVNADGAELNPSVFFAADAEAEWPTKERISKTRFAQFKKALPTERMTAELDAWVKRGGQGERPIIVGRPYRPEGRAGPVLPVAVPASTGRQMFLAVELALDRAEARFERAKEDGLDVALLDARGELALMAGQGLIEAAHFHIFQPDSSCAEVRYALTEEVQVLAACAPVRGTGWMVVVAEPMKNITKAGDEIRDRTGFISIFAGLLSVLFGMLFSLGVASRVSRIRDAALAVAEGDLGRTVDLSGSKEVRDLSRAFNFMSRRLSTNSERLGRQQEEIAAFNEELKRQLAEQKAELTDAHRLLLQSSRLVAVGEMGAGLAHELNNPLAGILGLVQVLRVKGVGDQTQLAEIEAQAQRCTHIVEQLTRFTGSARGQAPLEKTDWDWVDIGELLAEVSALVEGPMSAAGVVIECAPPSGVKVHGDRDALGSALLQICNSIRGGCEGGGVLALFGGASEKGVEIVFELTEGEIDSTSDDWMAAGMGFWLARQVFDSHGGRLQEPSPGAASGLKWVVQLRPERG
jgi:two-component system NtrC family sensor kinase